MTKRLHCYFLLMTSMTSSSGRVTSDTLRHDTPRQEFFLGQNGVSCRVVSHRAKWNVGFMLRLNLRLVCTTFQKEITCTTTI